MRHLADLDSETWLQLDSTHLRYLLGGAKATQSTNDAPTYVDGDRWIVKYLDDRLTVLDTKFNAVLQINAFSMAILALVSNALGSFPRALSGVSLLVARGFISVLVVILVSAVATSVVFAHGRLRTKFDHLESDASSYINFTESYSEVTHRRLKHIDGASRAASVGGAAGVLLALLVAVAKIWFS